jgi:drug efflux transport system permease protein
MRPVRLKAVALKEVLQILRDPRSLMLALMMPFLQMLLLGYAMSLDVSHVPTCTFDREVSPLSIELLNRFKASDYFTLTQAITSDRALKSAIDRGTCSLAIVIPRGFSRDLSARGHASVQAIVDASDNNAATIEIGYTQAVVAGFSSAVQRQFAGAAAAAMRPPIEVQSRVWFNEDMESRNFIIPGAVALVMALIGAQLTSLTVSREWERGTMELLVSTPVKPMEVMLGKLLPYFAIGVFDTLLCLIIALFWFKVPFRGAIFTLMLITGLYLVVVLGIGYLISVAIRNQLGSSQIALLVTLLPTVILSGLAFPVDQMPFVVQAISYLVYPRYYVTAMKAIFLKGSGLADLGMETALLAVYAALIALFAARAFRKNLD